MVNGEPLPDYYSVDEFGAITFDNPSYLVNDEIRIIIISDDGVEDKLTDYP